MKILSRAMPAVRRLTAAGWLLLLMAGAVAASAAPARAQSPAMSLVLAIDDSSSIKQDDYELQIRGIYRALTSPRFVSWVESQPGGIVVCAFLFSAAHKQHVILPWSRIEDLPSAEAAARVLVASGKNRLTGLTAVGSALEYAIRLLEHDNARAPRRVIDLSGDGESNDGLSPAAMRDRASALGITVNGLAILKNQPNVGAFYRDSVRTPDGFVVEARDFSDFESAMLNKLLREVAGGPPPGDPALR